MSRWKWLITLSVVMLLLSGCATTGKKAQEHEPATPADKHCFIATVGNDQARMRFDSALVAGNKVSGILEYRFAQKDQTWGIFSGTYSGSELHITYQYSSEGVISNREISYQIKKDGSVSGEGFIFNPSQSCAFTITPYEWKPLEIKSIKVDTTHDPETGYYARLAFDFVQKPSNIKYRCIGTVKSKEDAEIARWISIGAQDSSSELKDSIMMTNIKPDQVDLVYGGTATCEEASL